VIRVEIRRLPDTDQILMQVGDQWHLVIRTDHAATLGAMLLDAAYPDDPTAPADTYSIDVATN
jgi:hypothetical protein